MHSVMPLRVPAEGWTVDDLPDEPRRYELVDGALLVTPPPALRHDRAAMALALLLAAAAPQLRVLTAPGVRFDARNYRQPDVVLYDPRAADRDLLLPRDVVLAVEVVSASSVSTDRVMKPAQYAAAGIPHFWRLELDPLLLVVHRLTGGGYASREDLRDEVVLDEPVPLTFRLGDLLS